MSLKSLNLVLVIITISSLWSTSNCFEQYDSFDNINFSQLMNFAPYSLSQMEPLFADINNVTDQCTQTVFQILSGNLTDINPNVIMDSGKTFNDMGDYMNCLNKTDLVYISSNIKITIARKVIYNKIEPTLARFIMGFCLPNSCSSNILNQNSAGIVEKVNQVIGNITARKNISSPMNFTSLYFYNPQTDGPQITIGAILSITLVLLLFSITILGACYSSYHKSRMERRSRSTAQSFSGFAMSANAPNPSERTDEEQNREPLMVRLATAVSFTENCSQLFTVQDPVESPTNFPLFNGLRVVLIIWVVWGHDWWMRLMLYGNWRDLTIQYEKPGIMTYGGSGYYAVDSFFWLGGFLQTVLTVDKLRQDAEKSSRKLSPAQIFCGLMSHRWMRIWPSYMVALLFYYKIMPYLGSGPLWFNYTNMVKTCDDGKVWANVFFVDNLISHGESGISYCYGWAWYLSNDMQFFLVTPFILLAFIKRPKLGVLIVCGLMLAALIASISVVASYDYFYNFPSKDLPMQIQKSFMDTFYYLPYARIPPYLLGMLFGFLYCNKLQGEHTFGSKFGLLVSRSPFFKWTCWILGIVLPNWMVLSLIPIQRTAAPWSPFWRYIFVVFNQLIFTLGLNLLLAPSIFGSKDLINQFLSAQFLVPLARIQFSIYLVHLFIIDRNFWSLDALPYMNPVQAIYYFLADWPFVCFGAFMLCQIIETPMANVEKILLSSRSSRTPAQIDSSPLIQTEL